MCNTLSKRDKIVLSGWKMKIFKKKYGSFDELLRERMKNNRWLIFMGGVDRRGLTSRQGYVSEFSSAKYPDHIEIEQRKCVQSVNVYETVLEIKGVPSYFIVDCVFTIASYLSPLLRECFLLLSPLKKCNVDDQTRRPYPLGFEVVRRADVSRSHSYIIPLSKIEGKC